MFCWVWVWGLGLVFVAVGVWGVWWLAVGMNSKMLVDSGCVGLVSCCVDRLCLG